MYYDINVQCRFERWRLEKQLHVVIWTFCRLKGAGPCGKRSCDVTWKCSMSVPPKRHKKNLLKLSTNKLQFPTSELELYSNCQDQSHGLYYEIKNKRSVLPLFTLLRIKSFMQSLCLCRSSLTPISPVTPWGLSHVNTSIMWSTISTTLCLEYSTTPFLRKFNFLKRLKHSLEL